MFISSRRDNAKSPRKAQPYSHATLAKQPRIAGATLGIEENYLIKKLFCGGLGVLSIENQARI